MKLSGMFLAFGVVPLVHLACAQVTGGGGGGGPSAIRAGTARFTEEEIPYAGVAAVHTIDLGDDQVAEDLIGHLEADRKITGETFCPPSSVSRMHVGHAAPTRRANGGANWHQIKSEALMLRLKTPRQTAQQVCSQP